MMDEMGCYEHEVPSRCQFPKPLDGSDRPAARLPREADCKLQVAIFDRPRSAIYIIHLDIDYINNNSFEV
jgi:hypothetical protein